MIREYEHGKAIPHPTVLGKIKRVLGIKLRGGRHAAVSKPTTVAKPANEPLPDKEARERILKTYSYDLKVGNDVNFAELARCTDGFNGAQCEAVCVEAVS